MSHKYKKDGFEYPSVTTIISDCTDKSGALTQWAANMTSQYAISWIDDHSYCDLNTGSWVVDSEHMEEVLEDARFNFRNVSQEALDIGSAVHDAIEYYLIKGMTPELKDDKAKSGFDAFLKFEDDHKLKPLGLEETVYGNCWAGKLDYRGLFDGKKYVIDWKSSKAIYASDYGPQIAAYRSTFDDVEGCGILRLDKLTGEPEWKDFSKRYESDLNIFNKMVELYFARHPIISKKAGWKGELTEDQKIDIYETNFPFSGNVI